MRITVSVTTLVALLLMSSISPAQTVLQSTAEEQEAVEVTVYNNNFGLIKETRKVAIPKGRGELRFMDVAAAIVPSTVHVKSGDDAKGFSILEQNYEYDLMSAEKLLDKYVGKKIKLIEWNQYKDKTSEVDAVLLSNVKGQIFKINNEIYLGHPGIKVLPQLPENLIAKPTLTWLYENADEKPRKLEVSYLTNNINWQADYIAVLNKDDTAADISGWVTLDNKSGATYREARLKLIAGLVHRVPEDGEKQVRRKMALATPSTPAFEEKPFFEYHLYDLKRQTTIKDNQTKQVTLLEALGAKVEKGLLVYGPRGFYTAAYQQKKPKQPVNIYVTMRNSKANSLGVPLPAGIMRLYKTDSDGGRQFIGEDKIDHTPVNEEVKLKIGQAFDVVAERTQTDFKQVARRVYESEWEITVRNHKEEEVTVGIVEPLTGSWDVISKTHPFKKLDAFTIRFDVKVPKDGEAKVKYRVRVGL